MFEFLRNLFKGKSAAPAKPQAKRAVAKSAAEAAKANADQAGPAERKPFGQKPKAVYSKSRSGGGKKRARR